MCKAKDRGEIILCSNCMTFTHVTCLPPSPMELSSVKVLILHFLPHGSDISHLKNMLLQLNYFSIVDELNIHTHKPSLSQLRNYDSVLMFAYQDENDHSKWKEPDSLGDLLADYVMGNKGKNPKKGGVVVAPLTHSLALGGRWRKRKLSPLLPGRHLKNEQRLKLGTVFFNLFILRLNWRVILYYQMWSHLTEENVPSMSLEPLMNLAQIQLFVGKMDSR